MKSGIKTLAIWLILGFIFIGLLSAVFNNSDTKMSYSELLSRINTGDINEIELSSDGKEAYVTTKNSNVEKQVIIPSINSFMDKISDQLQEGEVTLTQKQQSIFVTILSVISPFAIVIIFFIFWMFLMNPVQGGNKSVSFGKSKARVVNALDKNKVTFADVAGVDEEKEELEEIVEFLKSPKKFTNMGARIPKGVLLVGQPGTGKTLLAKAVAGEAGVPFFIISGSDFVEMFVGVGASRVRDLFEEAKKNTPCIVFIDEIDAVGRQRGAGLGGGNDEREQTLNQLLVEMDGFEANEGIIVLAATNRSDVLDPALLRPGRFDRQIYVHVPDVKGREGIIKIHARNKPIDEDVDFTTLARITSGFTGADLENMLNEAAILAARANRPKIIMEDLTEGINKVIMGPQKKSRVMTENDKKITAYHDRDTQFWAKCLNTANQYKKYQSFHVAMRLVTP